MTEYNLKNILLKKNIDVLNFKKNYIDVFFPNINLDKNFNELEVLQILFFKKLIDLKIPAFVSYEASREALDIFDYFNNSSNKPESIFIVRNYSKDIWEVEIKVLKIIYDEFGNAYIENKSHLNRRKTKKQYCIDLLVFYSRNINLIKTLYKKNKYIYNHSSAGSIS